MIALAAAFPYFPLLVALLWKQPDGSQSRLAALGLILTAPFAFFAPFIAVVIVTMMALWWWASDFRLSVDVQVALSNLRRSPPKGLIYLIVATLIWTVCEVAYVHHLSQTVPGW
jgi:hypothetical protein